MEKNYYTSKKNTIKTELPSLDSVDNSIKFLEQMAKLPQGLSPEKQQILANQKELKEKIIAQNSKTQDSIKSIRP
jgi:hypothetical protein